MIVTGAITLPAALLLGLAASGHCVVMCGGIGGALGMATARGPSGRPRVTLLVAYQAGRILSYALAGLLAGGLVGGVIGVMVTVDFATVSAGLRLLAGAALLAAAAVAFGLLRANGLGAGSALWQRLAPLGRRLLPVTTLPRALAFGMVWGWMPCGFIYSVLLLAIVAADPLIAAATMLAFGLGTIPAMLATALGAPQLVRFAGRPWARQAAGAVLLAGAVLTVVAPWLPMGHGTHPDGDVHAPAMTETTHSH
jgi:sulfite exporter TauE/SafE